MLLVAMSQCDHASGMNGQSGRIAPKSAEEARRRKSVTLRNMRLEEENSARVRMLSPSLVIRMLAMKWSVKTALGKHGVNGACAQSAAASASVIVVSNLCQIIAEKCATLARQERLQIARTIAQTC